MDQRKKRLAGLIALYVAKIVGLVILLLAIIALIIMIFGSNTPGVLVILVTVSGIGVMAYTLAKDKLDDLESDEQRILDRMSRDE
jgi:low affinity Fe/Cu permease